MRCPDGKQPKKREKDWKRKRRQEPVDGLKWHDSRLEVQALPDRKQAVKQLLPHRIKMLDQRQEAEPQREDSEMQVDKVMLPDVKWLGLLQVG